MSPDRTSQIWIIGTGQVGSRALTILSAATDPDRITVVDRQRRKFGDTHFEAMDGVDFLAHNLNRNTAAWIVPAIPTHLAFEWLRRRLSSMGALTKIPVPPLLSKDIPLCTPGEDNRSYVSNATFRCPSDCSEPDICPGTAAPRPLVMHEHLANLKLPHLATEVIRSHQLAPGVGGFRGADLWEACSRIGSNNGSYLIATACRCHGVVDAVFYA